MQPMEGMGGNTGVVWIWSATSSLPLMKPTGLSRAWTCTAAPMLQCLAFNRSWALSVYDVFHHVFQVIHSMWHVLDGFFTTRVERKTSDRHLRQDKMDEKPRMHGNADPNIPTNCNSASRNRILLFEQSWK